MQLDELRPRECDRGRTDGLVIGPMSALALTYLDALRPRQCDRGRTDRSLAIQSLLQLDELRPRKCHRSRTDGLEIGPKSVLAVTHLDALRPRKCDRVRMDRSSACQSPLQFDELRPRSVIGVAQMAWKSEQSWCWQLPILMHPAHENMIEDHTDWSSSRDLMSLGGEN